jgi:hypothetical protein
MAKTPRPTLNPSPLKRILSTCAGGPGGEPVDQVALVSGIGSRPILYYGHLPHMRLQPSGIRNWNTQSSIDLSNAAAIMRKGGPRARSRFHQPALEVQLDFRTSSPTANPHTSGQGRQSHALDRDLHPPPRRQSPRPRDTRGTKEKFCRRGQVPRQSPSAGAAKGVSNLRATCEKACRPLAIPLRTDD